MIEVRSWAQLYLSDRKREGEKSRTSITKLEMT